MNEVTLDFEVIAVCDSAEGLKSGSLLNGKAGGVITISGLSSDVQSGSGPVKVSGRVTALIKPDGSDGMALLKGKTTFEAVACTLKGHTLEFKQDVADGAVTLTVSARLINGSSVVVGSIFVDVNKWLWKLALRRAMASFQGALKPA